MKDHVFDFIILLRHSVEPVVGSLLRGAVVSNCPSHLRCISVAFLWFHFADPGVTPSCGIVAGVMAHAPSVTSPATAERVRFTHLIAPSVPVLLWAIVTKMSCLMAVVTGDFP